MFVIELFIMGCLPHRGELYLDSCRMAIEKLLLSEPSLAFGVLSLVILF